MDFFDRLMATFKNLFRLGNRSVTFLSAAETDQGIERFRRPEFEPMVASYNNEGVKIRGLLDSTGGV